MDKNARKMHKELDRRCKEWNKLAWAFRKLYGGGLGSFKFQGEELINGAEEFAEEHPEVKIAWVDDTHFTSSCLVFIPHECKDEYWGTTAILIPQCSGDPPTEFFLYPGHVTGLIKVLREIEKKQKAKPRK